MRRAAPFGKMLGKKETYHRNCADGNRPLLFGKGGEHMVCGPPPSFHSNFSSSSASAAPCNFLSFGIRDDPSFDVHLSEEWRCQGFAGDPSIIHPSKLSPTVTFHNVGLTMLRENVEQRTDRDAKLSAVGSGGAGGDGKKDLSNSEWILTSLPSLQRFLGWNTLDIVKIDCEGCEVSLARDILAEDRNFLKSVKQISIETHGTRTWIDTDEELYYYALMFVLLEDAGFQLIWSNIFGCGRWEHDGCRPEMEEIMGMSCGSRPRNKANKVPIGWSCHDWLFQRIGS